MLISIIIKSRKGYFPSVLLISIIIKSRKGYFPLVIGSTCKSAPIIQTVVEWFACFPLKLTSHEGHNCILFQSAMVWGGISFNVMFCPTIRLLYIQIFIRQLINNYIHNNKISKGLFSLSYWFDVQKRANHSNSCRMICVFSFEVRYTVK
jgi:hypothetical protein